MYWHCNICDKIFYEEFRTNHHQSGYHKRLASLIIRKYIIAKPNGFVESIAEYLRSHYRKYEKIFATIVVNLLTSSNHTINIRKHFMCYPGQQRVYDARFFLVKLK